MSYPIIDAQSLARLAFNHPAFLANADCADVAMTSADFLSEAADKWEAHTGIAPTPAIIAAATVLLIGMTEAALVVRHEKEAEESWRADNASYRHEYDSERHGAWCL